MEARNPTVGASTRNHQTALRHSFGHIGLGLICAIAAITPVACSSEGSGASADSDVPPQDAQTDGGDDPGTEELFPDVLEVEIDSLGDNRYEISTTLSSPYDSPQRYADAWRVLDEDGNGLGQRELAHDHAEEQPFTRSTEVEIPDGVAEVTVQGRDQVSGWGGETVTVSVPR